MDRRIVQYLVCPRCGGDVRLIGDASESQVTTGELLCGSCGTAYPVVDGVPRLNERVAEHRLARIARTFTFEWTAHHRGDFEDQTLYGRTRREDWEMVSRGMGITAADVEGSVVLDAGCGSGRFCQLFAERGASLVIGVDIHDAVADVAHACRDYENVVQIVQANIFALPFKPELFDLVWCNGVIHHTPDPRGAHRSLAKCVRPGGILYVWVYPRRFSPFNAVKRLFDVLRIPRLPPRVLLLLANAMVYPSLALLRLYRAVRSIPGLRPRTAWGTRTARPRTAEELRLTWFDTIAPEFDSAHTEDEVIGWFEEAGFSEIETLDEPKLGVRGMASAESRLIAVG